MKSVRVYELAQKLGLNKHSLLNDIRDLELPFEVSSPTSSLSFLESLAVQKALDIPTFPLVGAWELQPDPRPGRFSSHTHLVFDEQYAWYHDPGRVVYEDRLSLKPYSAEFDDAFVMARIVIEEPRFCGIAKLGESTLEIRWGAVAGEFPKIFEDSHGSFSRYVFVAEPGPLADRPVPEPHPTRQHPALGELKFDQNLNWWEADVQFSGSPIHVSIEGSANVSDEVFDRASALLESLNVEELTATAATKLLKLHNESWRDNEEDLDAIGFQKSLTPASFVAGETGDAMVYFDDGGLFHGHSVFVALNASGEIVDASIA